VFKKPCGLKQTIVFWCQDNEDNMSSNNKNGYSSEMIDELRLTLKNKIEFNNQYIVEENIDRNDYLIQFGNTFSKAIENCINESWMGSDLEDLNLFDSEIMHQAVYCDSVLKESIQHDKILNKAKQYLRDFEDQKPFYIGGDVSSGKTYSIACLARLVSF
jgi:hypothetical protein